MTDKCLLASFLADLVKGQLVGTDVEVRGLATLANAGADHLSFLANSRYRHLLQKSAAGVVLVAETDQALAPSSAIVVDNPYLAYAKISQLFAPAVPLGRVSASAVISPEARVAATASVAPGAVIEAGAEVGENVSIGANSVVGRGAKIGSSTIVAANVTLYPDVIVGARCLVHSGAVIGADGFGFAPDHGRWQKIAQLGRVIIGDDVEIGANTTIDRGALDDTRIENGVKLDNQIQIAHNVIIGENTAIAGCTAIAGSTRIGKQCTIAGMSGITGHLDIVDGTHITAMTLVSRSITEPGAYSSGTVMEPHKQWKRNAVRFRQLDELTKRISELEKLLKQSSS